MSRIKSYDAFPAPPPTPPGPEYYILAIQWAYTVCGSQPSRSSSNFQKEFTIHGLWRYPELPSTPNSFKPGALAPIKAMLEKDWINAKKNNTNNQFWKHEYKKHGVRTSFSTTRLYFSKGLEAYGTLEKFGLGNFLVRLFAGKAASEQFIFTQLKSHLRNKNVGMICSTDGKSNLKELQLCFKYQVNTGIQGWTLDNLPFRRRCPTGDIRLPLL
ncbi:hypothetical protein C5167_007300 [Papaver somniferum]|nr:hypothetical protein C5167_007300 [Papaver somniferum]